MHFHARCRPVAILLLFGLSACGDDQGSSGRSDDAGEDPQDDPIGDGGDAEGLGDAALDADADAGPDTDVTSPGDCDPVPTCGDGATCAAGDVCTGGRCVPRWTPDVLTSAGATGIAAPIFRVAQVTLGAGNDEVVAGVDLDGDGSPDNALGRAIQAFPGARETAEREVNRLIEAGAFTLAIGIERWPDRCGDDAGTSAVRVVAYEATSDVDGDGFPDVMTDGGGLVQVLPETFLSGSDQPRCQLTPGADDGTTIRASGGEDCSLAFPLFNGQVVNLPINRLVVEIPSSAVLATKSDDPVAALVAGTVHVQDLVDELNRLGQGCACAGVNPDLPIASTRVVDGRLQGRCEQTVRSNSNETCAEQTDGQACANLSSGCLALSLFSQQVDIDSGEGTIDAASFAFSFGLEPSTLADPPLSPSLVARNDHYDVNRNLRLRPTQREVRVQPLLNDTWNAATDRLARLGEVSPASAPATLLLEGSTVRVNFPAEWPAEGEIVEVSFPYTIEGPAGSSEATVTMQVIARTRAPIAVDDRFTVVLDGGTTPIFPLANDELPSDPGTFPYLASIGTTSIATMTLAEFPDHILVTPTRTGTEVFPYVATAWSEPGGDAGTTSATIELEVVCPPGRIGETCEELDVCGDTGIVCDAQADCLEVDAGIFTCACRRGWTGDGATCEDENECEGEETPCGDGVCENTIGGFTCACVDDLVFDPEEGACVEPTPCLVTDDPCAPEEFCINLDETTFDCFPRGAWETVWSGVPDGFAFWVSTDIAIAAGAVYFPYSTADGEGGGETGDLRTAVFRARPAFAGGPWTGASWEDASGVEAIAVAPGTASPVLVATEDARLALWDATGAAAVPLADGGRLGAESDLFVQARLALLPTHAVAVLTRFDETETPQAEVLVIPRPTPTTFGAPLRIDTIVAAPFGFAEVVRSAAARWVALADVEGGDEDNGIVWVLDLAAPTAPAVQAIEPSLDGIQSFFGSSLAFAPDASFFVASAPFAPFPGCTRCETFFIYRLVDGVWTLAHAEPGLYGATGGFFALRVAADRGHLFVGASPSGGESYDVFHYLVGSRRQTPVLWENWSYNGASDLFFQAGGGLYAARAGGGNAEVRRWVPAPR